VPPVIGAIIAIVEASAAAIGTAFAATAAWLGVSTAALALGAISAVGSILLQLLMPKPDLGSFIQDAQERSQTVKQSIQPWRVLYGKVGKIGGVLTFWERSSDNKFTHIIVETAAHQITAFDEVYLDDKLVSFSSGGAGNYDPATGDYAGFVWRELCLGDPADSSQPFPKLAAELPAKWTSAHKSQGIAKIHLKFNLDPKKFPNGLPNPRFTIRGKPVLDTRTGITAYSNNAALVARDWATWSIGLKIDPANFPDAYTNAAANVCDESVPLSSGNGGGTEHRYEANGSFTTADDPKNVMEGLLSAMMGDLVPVGKEWRLYAGAWRAPSVTIAEGDFRGELSWNALGNPDETFNAVKGVFVSPGNNWQSSDFPAVTNSTYEAEDGRRIFKDISLPFTTSPTMAQRLAMIVLKEGRQQGTGALPLKLKLLDVAAPDNIQVNFTAFGWSGKYLKVNRSRISSEQGKRRPRYGMDFEVKETDPSIYSWSSSTEESTVIAGGTIGNSDNTVVQPVTSLSLTSGSATASTGADGIKIPRIKATWTAPADEMVKSGGHIVIGYKLNADSNYTWLGPIPGDATEIYIGGVTVGSAYDVRVIAENVAKAQSVAVDATNHTMVGPLSDITSSTTLNGQGSINPASMGASATIVGVLVSGVAKARVTVTAGTAYRSDNTTLSIPGSGPTDLTTWASGAVAFSTSYNGNIVWDVLTAAVVRQEFTGASTAQTRAAAFADGKIPIAYGINFTTPSSGGSGGGGGGGNTCFTGAVPVRLKEGFVSFDKAEQLVTLVGPDGRERAARKLVHYYEGELIQFDPEHPDWGVVPIHLMQDHDRWIAAEEKYAGLPRFQFEGLVFNYVVLEAQSFDDSAYVLGNGDVAHNMKIS
jgi:hypothetical protein